MPRERGISSPSTLETHFTDERRRTPPSRWTYRRLRRHWQFINELSCCSRSMTKSPMEFTSMARQTGDGRSSFRRRRLYHPETVERSFAHDGSGSRARGSKDPNGHWDRRPHRGSLIRRRRRAGTVARCPRGPRSPVSHAHAQHRQHQAARRPGDLRAVAGSVSGLQVLARAGMRRPIGQRGVSSHRLGARQTWEDAILQGPHLHVATPLYKSPNPTMKHNQDWSPTISRPARGSPCRSLPTSPAGDRASTTSAIHALGDDGRRATSIAARDFYRMAWRSMAANTGERTLIPAIIPPGAAHVDGIVLCAGADSQ